jgi:hypothetical protein
MTGAGTALAGGVTGAWAQPPTPATSRPALANTLTVIANPRTARPGTFRRGIIHQSAVTRRGGLRYSVTFTPTKYTCGGLGL